MASVPEASHRHGPAAKGSVGHELRRGPDGRARLVDGLGLNARGADEALAQGAQYRGARAVPPHPAVAPASISLTYFSA